MSVVGWLMVMLAASESGDFLLFAETRLIPARSRNESGFPACLGTSHVGLAGIGLVGLKGILFPHFLSLLLTFDGIGTCMGRALRGILTQVLAKLHICL